MLNSNLKNFIGFGICGVPEKLLEGLHDGNAKDLTIICNNPSIDDYGIGLLVQKKQVDNAHQRLPF